MFPLGDIFLQAKADSICLAQPGCPRSGVYCSWSTTEFYHSLALSLTGDGNQGQQPISSGSILLLHSWCHLTAILGPILREYRLPLCRFLQACLLLYSIIFWEGRRLNLALDFHFSLSPCWGDRLGISPHVLCREVLQNQVGHVGINSRRGQARQDLTLRVLWQPWCSVCGHESYDITVLLLIFIF